MKRHKWTPQQEATLKKMYPNTRTEDIALRLGLSIKQVYNKAFILNLKKSKEFIIKTSKENYEKNPNHPARKYHYQKGHTPFNKGKIQTEYMSPEAIEKTKSTRFKKGNIPMNAIPVGEESMITDKGGRKYITIKLPNKNRLQLKHIWLWEKHNGKVPKGYNVVFKNGNTMDCKIENLECISNAQLMERNSLHNNYPKEICEIIQLKGALQRQINKISKNESGN